MLLDTTAHELVVIGPIVMKTILKHIKNNMTAHRITVLHTTMKINTSITLDNTNVYITKLWRINVTCVKGLSTLVCKIKCTIILHNDISS